MMDNGKTYGMQPTESSSTQVLNSHEVVNGEIAQQPNDNQVSRHLEARYCSDDQAEEPDSDSQIQIKRGGRCGDREGSRNSTSLAEVKNSTAVHKHDIGEYSVASQSEAENFLMPVFNVERGKTHVGDKNHLMANFQQPMTRAKAKHVAGGSLSSSLSQ